MSPIYLFIQFMGGLVLFLYGLRLASKNLSNVAGNKLKVVLGAMTANRFTALLAGVVSTVALQSTTATAVVLVGLCQAGLLQLAASIGVLLGANLGSTITVQFIAFDFYVYALLILALGYLALLGFSSRAYLVLGGGCTVCGAICLLEGRTDWGWFLLLVGVMVSLLAVPSEKPSWGKILMGFALIFIGMKTIKVGMAPLASDKSFLDVFASMADKPLLLVLLGFVFTVLTNSSTATLGVAMALVSSGDASVGGGHAAILDSRGALAVVCGAHLGSCPMALMASVGGSREGKLVAWAHVFIKVSAAVCFYPLLSRMAEGVDWSTSLMGGGAARCVANAHAVFNLANVILVLPFVHQVAGMLERLVPEVEERRSSPFSEFVKEAELYPELLIESAELELKKLALYVSKMLEQAKLCLDADDVAPVRDLRRMDDKLDEIYEDLVHFVTSFGGSGNLSASLARRHLALIVVAGHLERLGDILSKAFAQTMMKRIRSGKDFSVAGLMSLRKIMDEMLLDAMDTIIRVMGGEDPSLLDEVLEGEERFFDYSTRCIQEHFHRLKKGVKDAEETSLIYLDVIGTCRNIYQIVIDICKALKGGDVLGQWTLPSADGADETEES